MPVPSPLAGPLPAPTWPPSWLLLLTRSATPGGRMLRSPGRHWQHAARLQGHCRWAGPALVRCDACGCSVVCTGTVAVCLYCLGVQTDSTIITRLQHVLFALSWCVCYQFPAGTLFVLSGQPLPEMALSGMLELIDAPPTTPHPPLRCAAPCCSAWLFRAWTLPAT